MNVPSGGFPPGHAPSTEVVRALLDPATPASDPVVQFFQVALSGFGYDFYDQKNNARANDLLVREKGSGLLANAARGLGRLERAYRERYIPAASREHPYPPADDTRRAKHVHALEVRCDTIASALLTAESPANDAIWSRVRDNLETLHRLLAADIQIVIAIQDVIPRIEALDASAVLGETALDDLDAPLDRLATVVDARRAALTI